MSHNWLQTWEKGDIPFHLAVVNPLLMKYWPSLNIKAREVLVPLCGKSLDLLWLAQQGHHVIGIELSDLACEAFFVENQLPFSKQKIGDFIHYHHQNIDLYCGDFFQIPEGLIPPVAAVYDRAALIALPEKLRTRYVNQVRQLMCKDGLLFLIVLDSPDQVQGPPYPVSFAAVEKLYGQHFHIEQLVHFQEKEVSEHLHDKGYREISDAVYLLRKQD